MAEDKDWKTANRLTQAQHTHPTPKKTLSQKDLGEMTLSYWPPHQEAAGAVGCYQPFQGRSQNSNKLWGKAATDSAGFRLSFSTFNLHIVISRKKGTEEGHNM